MTHSSVLYVYSERESFQLDPEYQRQGDIWPLEKRQLLIDSILNGYDIPKIYFHRFLRPKRIGGHLRTHAIIDGKQRLASIWGFIDGDFPLSEDIEFLSESRVDLQGLTYAELGKQYPKLKQRFDACTLSVIEVDTADLDLIEDMFSRLNEAVPLSAAEKRNAFGGPMPPVIRKISRVGFFTKNLPFGNSRYRHFDLAVKCLLIESSDKVVDTKKIYLDDFVRDSKGKKSAPAERLGKQVSTVASAMAKVFTASDPLLRSVGMVVLYYHVFRIAINDGWVNKITRSKLAKFEKARADNRAAAELDIGSAEYDLLEFDRYVQTPNDGYAIGIRLNILLGHVFDLQLSEEYEP